MSDIDDYDRCTINALMDGYRLYYANDSYRAVAIEEEFRLPILNPQSERLSASKTFEYAGKIDLLVCDELQPGKLWLMDHKTTSEAIDDPGSEFWLRLHNATQPSHYQLALKQSGIEIDGCVWDVIRKPSIRPRKTTKAERQEIEMFGTYCGQPLPEVVQPPEFETPELYGARVLREIKLDPTRWYARQIVPRTNQDLYEYAGELFGISTRIRDSARTNSWYKTGEPHSCTLYGRSCEYLPLCSRKGSELDYLRVDGHAELEQDQSGLKILTNSSLSMYRQCERKYFYRHIEGLTKSTTSPALSFGTAFHVAMNNYWSDRLVPQAERISLQGVSVG